jgi:hypothetical protein
MISYYEINTNRRILATNITAVSEFSGLSYHKIRNWLNGSDLYKDDNIIIFQQDVVKGKQRLSKKDVSLSPERREYVEQLIKDKRVFPMDEEKELPKRKTKQPEKRDMSGFDNFFSEVK